MPKEAPATGRQATGKRTAVRNKASASASGVRTLTLPERRWHKPATWKYPAKTMHAPLPKAWVLLAGTAKTLWNNKKLFVGIAAIYGLLDIVLVRGLSGDNNLKALKESLGTAHGLGDQFVTATSSFSYLLANSGGSNTAASGAYQTVLLLITSLAIIWALRQVLANNKVRIRDAFYKGMYPLVQFFLVFLLLSVQLLPIAIGTSIYSVLVSNQIIVSGWESMLALVILIAIIVWSLRNITATIIALYVVTLPDMTPMQAYRSAKQLVTGRRMVLWLKFIFLIVVLLLVAAVIEFPLILLWTPGAVWVFFVLTLLALPVVHGYLYNLYREML